MKLTDKYAIELARGERFEFGKNWQRFLKTLDEARITEAERSLREMLEIDNLQGKSFLDIGSGSGLFSLAARRLGARVHSFDYDPQSVICTAELKRQYVSEDANWTVEEGSVLDDVYMQSLGKFDVIYSWGVIHYTGAMWKALGNAGIPVVATKVGGNSEAVADCSTGWLVPLRHPAAMAGRIVDLLGDTEKAISWGARGRERVKKLFTIEQMVKKHLQLYQSVHVLK